MFILLLFASLVLFITYVTIHHKRKWRALDNIPSPPAYPIIGHLPIFLGPMEKVSKNLRNTVDFHERMVKVWAGPLKLIFIVNPKDAEIILKNSKDIDKSPDYKYWKSLVGESLFTTNTDARYKRNKKLILPSLTLNNVKEFFDLFNKHTDNLINTLKNKTGHEFNIGSDISKCSMNILLETVLGYSKEDLQIDANAIIDAVDRFGKFGSEKVLKYWLRSNFISWLLGYEKEISKYYNYMGDVTSQIIHERFKNRNQNDDKFTVFIDTLLDARDDNGPCFSLKEIQDEIITIIFAGQDTITTALGFSLCLLGIYKDVQDKLYEEVETKLDKDDCYATYDTVKELEYLGRVIQETLRLYPSAPVVGKVALNDINLDGQIIPKDTKMVISLYHLQRNRNDFPNPKVFDPDNFLPERISSRHPYSYIPFSSGNRTCIGKIYSNLLLKVVLAKIILNFKIHSIKPKEEYNFSFEPTIRQKDGFLVTLEPRNNKKGSATK